MLKAQFKKKVREENDFEKEDDGGCDNDDDYGFDVRTLAHRRDYIFHRCFCGGRGRPTLPSTRPTAGSGNW